MKLADTAAVAVQVPVVETGEVSKYSYGLLLLILVPLANELPEPMAVAVTVYPVAVKMLSWVVPVVVTKMVRPVEPVMDVVAVAA